MCYSAQIVADYRKYVKMFGPDMDIREFARLYWERVEGSGAKVPKGMDAAFVDPATEEEHRIKQWIERYDAAQATKLEQELFKQRTRLADAARVLQTKSTKATIESKQIATGKVAATLRRLDDLRRTEAVDRDSRIFPCQYAPVMVMENGRRVIKPMRYQCRPAGKPAIYDVKYPGTYNARRDNLEGFWKGLFGYTHGLMLVSAFYENVPRHRMEGRELAEGEKEENVVLEFKPNPPQDMLIACLWSKWTGRDEPDLLSFAAVTDDPPAEIALAGHDRCIIPIKPENISAWLNPDPADLDAQYAILDDRHQPYYEYRLAA
ncbi:SOS response-associated peptidase family protein [Burkholderia sp. S171]|uniref:SOS response-associated peptidase family protein n=1 Tax=Burkholderia sp. S171 TaxID=1641860 RepID=UPI00131AC149|nr:SOS response-associated peptidase family protein [Burkholderia sp. S171]